MTRASWARDPSDARKPGDRIYTRLLAEAGAAGGLNWDLPRRRRPPRHHQLATPIRRHGLVEVGGGVCGVQPGADGVVVLTEPRRRQVDLASPGVRLVVEAQRRSGELDRTEPRMLDL